MSLYIIISSNLSDFYLFLTIKHENYFLMQFVFNYFVYIIQGTFGAVPYHNRNSSTTIKLRSGKIRQKKKNIFKNSCVIP